MRNKKEKPWDELTPTEKAERRARLVQFYPIE